MKKTVEHPAAMPVAMPAGTLLSLIIPCYNESKRLDIMLKGLADFDRKWKGSYEVIVVDDGSTDGTATQLKALLDGAFSQLTDKITILAQPKNAGKGEALKTGVAAATGDYFLTLDADMSTAPAELLRWQLRNPQLFKSGTTIYIGSRKHAESEVKALSSRRLVGGIFNSIVQMATGLHISDTQCGFKLYPAAARKLFAGMKSKGWAHDVELLSGAKNLGLSIEEMPVSWENRDESKVNVAKDSFFMLFQVIGIGLGLWWRNTFVAPFRLASVQGTAEKRMVVARSVFNILSLLLLVVMPILSRHYAVTGDEHWHRDYGNDIYDYFFHGSDAAQTATTGIQYYGGLFDFITAWCFRTFHFATHYATMHFINAIVGAIGIIYAGRLAKLLGGTTAGIIAMVLLVCSPSFFGHNFANPKDIPFSTGYIAGLYYILLFLRSLPVLSARAIIGLVLSIGFAMGVRIGGLLLIIYLIAFIAGYLVMNPAARKVNVKKLALNVGLISILGYAIAIICWPYAHLDIIGKPLESLKVMSNFFITINLLYDGRTIMSNQVPWYYIPKYILNTAPVLVLVSGAFGIMLSLLQWRRDRKQTTLLSCVVFAVFFPVLYAIYKHSSLYDGWRHFLFIYPPLVVLAALGLAAALLSSKKMLSYAAVAALIAGVIHPLLFTFRNHPFETLYVNEISGGLKKMYGNYEIDYYMMGIKPASDWLLAQEGIKTKQVTVATNCIFPVQEYFSPYKNVKVVYVRLYERYQTDWDYCIFFSRFVDRSQLISGNWPLPETIHRVDVDGVNIASVLKRRTHKDFQGFEAMKKNDLYGAKSAFGEALTAYPQNDQAWAAMMQLYAAEQKPDSVLYAGSQALKTYPGSLNVIQQMGDIYLKEKQPAQAIQLYDVLTQYNPEYGHLLKGAALAMGGNLPQALDEIDQSLRLNGANPQALQMGIQLAQAAGDADRMDRYTTMMEQLQAAQDEADAK